ANRYSAGPVCRQRSATRKPFQTYDGEFDIPGTIVLPHASDFAELEVMMVPAAKPELCERQSQVDSAYRNPERPVLSDGQAPGSSSGNRRGRSAGFSSPQHSVPLRFHWQRSAPARRTIAQLALYR